jgi:hypothetical protein
VRNREEYARELRKGQKERYLREKRQKQLVPESAVVAQGFEDHLLAYSPIFKDPAVPLVYPLMVPVGGKAEGGG